MVRLASIAIGAIAIMGVGLLVATAHGLALDRAADGAMRRVGLPQLVTRSYRSALLADVPYLIPALIAASLGSVMLWKRRRGVAGPDAASGMFWGALIAWGLVAVGAVVLLLGGFPIPGQRLAPICLAVPAVITIWLAMLASDRSWTVPARLIIVVPTVTVLLASSWALWNANAAGPPNAVVAVRSIGPVVAAEPRGTPIVLVVDARGDRPAIPALQDANAVRAVVPASRVPDIHVFMGSPADFLAGRPTITGSPQHDRLARDYWARLQPELARGALAVVVRSFDPQSYAAAVQLHGSRQLAPGVMALPGYVGRGRAAAGVRASMVGVGPTQPAPGYISPWIPVGLAPGVLILLVVIGLPLARWLLSDGSPWAQVALAPSIALGALAFDAIAVDRTGGRLGSPAGIAEVVVLLAAEVAAAWFVEHRTSFSRGPGRARVGRDHLRTKTYPSSS
jgi:hypothetical protein